VPVCVCLEDSAFYESPLKRKPVYRLGADAGYNRKCRQVGAARHAVPAFEAGPLPSRSQNALQLLQQTVQLRAVAALMVSPSASPQKGHAGGNGIGQPLLAGAVVDFRPSNRLQVCHVTCSWSPQVDVLLHIVLINYGLFIYLFTFLKFSVSP